MSGLGMSFLGCCRVLRKLDIFSIFINDLGPKVNRVLMKFISGNDLEMFLIPRRAEK